MAGNSLRSVAGTLESSYWLVLVGFWAGGASCTWWGLWGLGCVCVFVVYLSLSLARALALALSLARALALARWLSLSLSLSLCYQSGFSDPGAHGDHGDAHTQPSVGEPLLGAYTVWVGHTRLRGSHVIVEASVLVCRAGTLGDRCVRHD
jgi:hypothetical protein